jgi:hypothetical protein
MGDYRKFVKCYFVKEAVSPTVLVPRLSTVRRQLRLARSCGRSHEDPHQRDLRVARNALTASRAGCRSAKGTLGRTLGRHNRCAASLRFPRDLGVDPTPIQTSRSLRHRILPETVSMGSANLCPRRASLSPRSRCTSLLALRTATCGQKMRVPSNSPKFICSRCKNGFPRPSWRRLPGAAQGFPAVTRRIILKNEGLDGSGRSTIPFRPPS